MRTNDIFGLFGKRRSILGQARPIDEYFSEYPLPEIPPNAPDIYMEKYEDAQDLQEQIREQFNRMQEEAGSWDPQTEYDQTEALDKLVKEYEHLLEDLEVERQLLSHEQPQYGPLPSPFTPQEPPEPPPTPWNPQPEFGPAPFANKPPLERPPVATGGPRNGPINNASNPFSWNNAPNQTPDVPSVDCGPGQFFDGRQCRGSVNMPAGGLVNQAMNLGPSGGPQMVSPGSLDVNPASLSVPSFGGMGRRFPVINL